MTILESLKGVNAYPIPLRTLAEVMERRGLAEQATEEATQEVLTGAPFNLAVADLLFWLALAPNVTQGGQSYSFTDEQRLQFRNRAHKLWEEYGDEDEDGQNTTYGYKGDRF